MAGRKPGRPKKNKDEVKSTRFCIRMSKDDEKRLRELQIRMNISQSEIIREGIGRLAALYGIE